MLITGMKNSLLLVVAIIMAFSFTKINVQDDPWVAPESAKEIENIVPEKKRAASAKKGEKVFMKRCSFCHGETAKGDGPAGARFTPKPANLTSESVQGQTDGEIFWKVSNGRGNMPKWESILSEEERWDVVNFIRTVIE